MDSSAHSLHTVRVASVGIAGCLRATTCSQDLLSILSQRGIHPRRSLPLSYVFANLLLQPGDCFVLCDAGGGTVVSFSPPHTFPPSDCLPSRQDVISYKVRQLEPSLELEKMTISTSLHLHPLGRKSLKADWAYRRKVWVCIYRCKFQAMA